jgi:hypothetical protein
MDKLLNTYHFDKKIRLGNKNDGGYVIGELGNIYDCYISCGVSIEESFSRDFIIRYNMNEYNSFAFDGTIEHYPYNYTRNISYIKKNISNYNNQYNTDLTYLLKTYKSIFIKMDIEGGEYSWLLNLDQRLLENIMQMTIEFHGINNDSWLAKYEEKVICLNKLLNTHYIIHAHGNNNVGTTNRIPDVIELTFVNKKYFKETPELNKLPLPDKKLDNPNTPRQKEIDLNVPPFVN